MANKNKNGNGGFIAIIALIFIVAAAIVYIVFDGMSSKSDLLEDDAMADILSETLGKSQRSITEEDIATLEGFQVFSVDPYNILTICLPGYTEAINAEEIDNDAVSSLIKQFDLNEYEIETYNDLRFFTGLKELILPVTDYSDLSFLSNMTALETLYIDGATVNGKPFNDLSFLSSLTNLKSFSAYGNSVADISALSSLTSLETLYLDYNSIEDVTPISGLTSLKNISLSGNRITDVSSLTNFNAEEVVTLDLSGNSIEDWSALDYLGDKVVKTYETEETSGEETDAGNDVESADDAIDEENAGDANTVSAESFDE